MTVRRVSWLLVALVFAWAGWTARQIVRTGNEALARGASSPASGDAAVVLGAAVRGEEPSPVFAARLDHGIALVQSGAVKALLLTGGTRDSSVLTESEVGRQYALARGVPPEAIRAETRSQTTAQNLACIQPVAEASGAETVWIVSDPLHVRRGTMLARAVGLDAQPAPTPTSRYRSWRTRLPFLLREVWYTGVFQVRQAVGSDPIC